MFRHSGNYVNSRRDIMKPLTLSQARSIPPNNGSFECLDRHLTAARIDSIPREHYDLPVTPLT
jgi:hypothetical protein